MRFREVMKVCPTMYSVEFSGGTHSDMANSHRNNGLHQKGAIHKVFQVWDPSQN